MKISVVVDDQTVIVDGTVTAEVDLSFLPKDIHAIHWFGTHGEIEIKNINNQSACVITENQNIDSLSEYQQQLLAAVAVRQQQIIQDTAAQTPAVPADQLVVAQRNRLLFESDWTQLPDSPLSTEIQTQWKTYRQALRDITDQSGFPDTVIWPVRPQ